MRKGALNAMMFCFFTFSLGTMKAACDLLEMADAKILACVVVIEFKELNGSDKLKYPLLSYIS